MAIKKTELYSSLWASCDELRGGMDASQYKDYVLTFLFLKYVSDKSTGSPYDPIEVPEGAHFDDIIALKSDKEIGDKLNKIIGKLAEANNLKNVIDVADFNDEDKLGKGKEMVDRLTKLVGIFQGLELGDNRAEHDDLLGDAYEYLMRHFATESGKSKGQFYTPSEVSRILAKVVGIKNDCMPDVTVYDATCGSGSLLLKASDEAANGLSIYGQEMDNATAALSRMNMILHNNTSAKITQGNTLSTPEYKNDDNSLKTFDFAVANPPFSVKSWDNGINVNDDTYKRFEYGIPPDKNGDYAFLLHILKSLKSTGKGAVILPHGVLFRGNAEARIRENLIKQGFIKGIIGLPANLFYGTGIPACIIVLDKEHAASRAISQVEGDTAESGIFMVDASKGFMKDGNKNRLREQDIHKVVDLFSKQVELTGYSRMVNLSEVVANDYNLNIPRYIDSSAAEDLHDLSAHLSGGIPSNDIDALSSYWKVFPTLKQSLFKPAREGYETPLVKACDVKNAILAHAEFKSFATTSIELFEQWKAQAKLLELSVGDHPKEIINHISDQLLNRYADAKLLDKYDIYQLLMDYWQETLQDDVYAIIQDDWSAGKLVKQIFPSKGKDGKNVWKESHDFEFKKERFKADIIPPKLIINNFYDEDQKALDFLISQQDQATQTLEDFIENQNGEEDLLIEAKNDKDKVVQKNITARIKVLEINLTDEEELDVLKECLKLVKAEATSKKVVKDYKLQLDSKVFKKYRELSEKELKTLIVQDKWYATLHANISAEIERVTQQLAKRVKTLEERYAEPLPKLTENVSGLASKVDEHLKAMGLSWQGGAL